jgi:hypothetical protein
MSANERRAPIASTRLQKTQSLLTIWRRLSISSNTLYHHFPSLHISSLSRKWQYIEHASGLCDDRLDTASEDIITVRGLLNMFHIVDLYAKNTLSEDEDVVFQDFCATFAM